MGAIDTELGDLGVIRYVLRGQTEHGRRGKQTEYLK